MLVQHSQRPLGVSLGHALACFGEGGVNLGAEVAWCELFRAFRQQCVDGGTDIFFFATSGNGCIHLRLLEQHGEIFRLDAFFACDGRHHFGVPRGIQRSGCVQLVLDPRQPL